MRLKPALTKIQGNWFLVSPLIFPEFLHSMDLKSSVEPCMILNRLHVIAYFECDVLTLKTKLFVPPSTRETVILLVF